MGRANIFAGKRKTIASFGAGETGPSITSHMGIMNFHQRVVSTTQYSRQFSCRGSLITVFNCPASARLMSDKFVPMWSQYNYIVYVTEGRKIWHTGHGTFELKEGACVFVRKGAWILEQFFDIGFCVVMFFIPDEFLCAVLKSKAKPISRKGENYDPIILKVEHHEPHQVYEYYRGSDVCMVTSLHDGMNLVAKEFVASRDDERSVLILSQFTGAARELPESLLVNPYNIDQCAEALEQALTMSPKEQRERMRSMRSLIQEFNVYRWAGRMLLDASRMRQRNRLLRRRANLIALKGVKIR